MSKKSQTARSFSSLSWAEFQSHVRYLSTGEQIKIKEAFDLGAEIHGDQKRKSGEPYFSHPIIVAHILADMGADANTIIAAFLHDSLEDTPLSEDEIEERFGKTVLTMITALTKLYAEDFAERPTLDDQVETMRKLFTAMQEDVRIMVIKLADRLHNMQTLEFLPEERQQSMAQETLDIYVKIADRLSMEGMRDELEELALKVLEPELFTKLFALRTKSETFSQQTLKGMRSKIREFGPSFSVDLRYEHKSWPRLRTLLKTEGSTVTGVSGLTMVFVCDSTEMCYRTLGMIHQIWQRESLSFQDYINTPMINGYRGLHTTIIGARHGTRILCAIRTRKMQEYARKGITTMCFDSAAVGVLDYLPWTKSIAPLSEDTVDRSEDFWQSLQSDILGESISIHGLDDQPQLLPKGSTALDGAFYLYQDHALRLKMVKVNGEEVPFHTPLENGISLECGIGSRSTVSREWLQWAHTGLAAAKIREGLSRQPREKKIAVGKKLLEEVMVEKKKGLLVEFDEKSLQKNIFQSGHDSFEESFVAVAEGKLDPYDLFSALFAEPQKKQSGTEAKNAFTLAFSMDKDNIDTLRRLVSVYERYNINLGAIHIVLRPFSSMRRFRVSAALSPESAEALQRDVIATGATEVTIHRRKSRLTHGAMVGAIVALWGLDPVVAHWLLQGAASAIDIAFVRFLVVFLAANVLYAAQFWTSKQKLKPLPLFHPSLILASVALFFTGFATYMALSTITPIQYILFIIAGGVTFTSLLRSFRDRQSIIVPAMVMVVCLLSALSIMIIQGTSLAGVSFALVGALSFGLYTELSRRYQEEVAQVKARFPAFLFWLSGFTLILSLPLLPFTNLLALPPGTLAIVAAFVLCFAFLPYAFYYFVVRSVEATDLDRQLLFVCLATIVGEIFLTGNLTALLAFPVLIALGWWDYHAEIRRVLRS